PHRNRAPLYRREPSGWDRHAEEEREDRRMRARIALSGAAIAGAAVFAALGAASGPDGPTLTSVPSPMPKAVGFAPASQLSSELRQVVVAEVSMPLENPQGIIGWYGYENDAPSPDDP